jgi:hypothetical protein
MAILDDVKARSDIERDVITVVRAEAVIWNDGSLGCPQPGMTYTQAPVAGYWVELSYDGELFDYRANESGFFFLCEQSLPSGAGTPGGGTGTTPDQ